MTTETVWLLFAQQDYESKELHSVYEIKPDEDELFMVLEKHYSHTFDPEIIAMLADRLYEENRDMIVGFWTLRECKCCSKSKYKQYC